jgi:hypothetical protein
LSFRDIVHGATLCRTPSSLDRSCSTIRRQYCSSSLSILLLSINTEYNQRFKPRLYLWFVFPFMSVSRIDIAALTWNTRYTEPRRIFGSQLTCPILYFKHRPMTRVPSLFTQVINLGSLGVNISSRFTYPRYNYVSPSGV